MAENVIKVRGKRQDRARTTGVPGWMFVAGALIVVAVAILAFDAYSGMIGIMAPRFEIVQSGASRIIKVPPGGNVQAAIELANGGDIIELQAGAVYYGEIKLPNKPINDYVTIQSSAAANLPPDKRVAPDQSQSMAKIVTPNSDRPAVLAANGAHHYRFVGIEFSTSSAVYTSNLVMLGTGESRPERLPHDIEIDRSYLHPFKTGITRRGIALNSAATTIKNSYIEGFGFMNEETQGICGWTGTRDIHILNNYVEAGAENIMFGGSDPDNAELIPMDIEIRGNHLNKPVEWTREVRVKTLFELKNAKRVQLVGNLLTNNWQGSAFRITVRNQDNTAPFSTIEDVLIKDNVVDNAGEGINILGKDDTHSSQTLKRLTIENNLFLNVAGGGNVEGSGYFIQVTDGEEITIANNTVFNSGNITTFYGVLPRKFVFRDNIVCHGSHGIQGPLDLHSDAAKAMFQNNVFMNLNRVGTGDYAFPKGNTIVAGIKDVGFVGPAAKDFRLAPTSRFKGKSSKKTDIGYDSKQNPDFPALTAQ